MQNPELPIEYLDYAARLQRVSKAAAREELERRAAAAAIADVAKKSPRKPPAMVPATSAVDSGQSGKPAWVAPPHPVISAAQQRLVDRLVSEPD